MDAQGVAALFLFAVICAGIILAKDKNEQPPKQQETPMPTDTQKQELIDKVSAWIAHRFGGDYSIAFAYYDHTKSGKMNRADIGCLLKDSDIGNAFTRGLWVDAILAELDTDGDGALTLADVQRL